MRQATCTSNQTASCNRPTGASDRRPTVAWRTAAALQQCLRLLLLSLRLDSVQRACAQELSRRTGHDNRLKYRLHLTIHVCSNLQVDSSRQRRFTALPTAYVQSPSTSAGGTTEIGQGTKVSKVGCRCTSNPLTILEIQSSHLIARTSFPLHVTIFR